MEILPMYMMLCNKSECEVFLVEAVCVCVCVCVCMCVWQREGGNIHPLKERKDLNFYFLFYFNIHVKQENTPIKIYWQLTYERVRLVTTSLSQDPTF